MHARWRRRLGVAAAALAVAACATPRLHDGVFRAHERFRVTVPGPAWEVAAATRTALALRHRDGRAGIMATVDCGESVQRPDPPALVGRLFVGLRERETLANGPATVGGLPAAHAIVQARVGGPDDRMRMEAYVVKDERCVYDLVYAAPPAEFEAQRADFRRFVESFAKE
jgi:hypothetical protein